MSITKSFLEGLGISSEIAEKIFAERSTEILSEKEQREKLEKQLEEKESTIATLTGELDTLKDSNKTAEEYKAELERVQREYKEKENQANAEREAREKAEANERRFNTVVGEKKFVHEAIRESYLKKFGDAVADAKYEGKSDADILHDLTKDDSSAFLNVSALDLPGAEPKGTGTELDDAKTRAVMGLPPLK